MRKRSIVAHGFGLAALRVETGDEAVVGERRIHQGQNTGLSESSQERLNTHSEKAEGSPSELG